jgi:hypothetical protein
MSFEKKISRQYPGLICLVLDDSASMGENLPGTTDPKCKWNERYAGILAKELLSRSSEAKNGAIIVKPRYYLHTIVYGSKPEIWGTPCMDIEAFVQKYTQEGNSLGLSGRFGGTDSAAAFQMALDALKPAVADAKFKDSFPPMLFHLTDGESQSDAQALADQIKQLATSDGNVLVVNAYIGTQTSLNFKGPEDFPGYLDASEAGPSSDNLRLFQMSSVAPDTIQQNLVDDGIFPKLRPGSRLFFDVRTKEMLKHVIQVVGSIGSRMAR